MFEPLLVQIVLFLLFSFTRLSYDFGVTLGRVIGAERPCSELLAIFHRRFVGEVGGGAGGLLLQEWPRLLGDVIMAGGRVLHVEVVTSPALLLVVGAARLVRTEAF